MVDFPAKAEKKIFFALEQVWFLLVIIQLETKKSCQVSFFWCQEEKYFTSAKLNNKIIILIIFINWIWVEIRKSM